MLNVLLWWAQSLQAGSVGLQEVLREHATNINVERENWLANQSPIYLIIVMLPERFEHILRLVKE